jgi:uncharacterized protein
VFMGLSAYVAMKGLWALGRATWLDPVALNLGTWGWKHAGLDQLLLALGLSAQTALWVTAAACTLGLLAFCAADRGFWRKPRQWVCAVLIGLLVVAGWWLSGHLGYGENPETLEQVYFATNSRTLESLSFVAPTGFVLELLMLWTDKSLKPTLGISLVVGVVLGAALCAWRDGSFRWEGFASLGDLRMQLLGAVLMGLGGVTAMGCTVGQGLTGLSTLSLGSVIAVAGIVTGCVATLRWLLWRAEQG